MKKNIFILLLTFTVSNFFAQSENSNSVSTKIKTSDGMIEGTLEKSGILSFKGIPFAAPPVGNFRWKTPQPLNSWSGIKTCKTFGASPMQDEPKPFLMWSEEFLIPDRKSVV